MSSTAARTPSRWGAGGVFAFPPAQLAFQDAGRVAATGGLMGFIGLLLLVRRGRG